MVVALLEEQHPVALDVGGMHRVAEAVRHDAEILADDDRLPRLRHLGDGPHQVGERVADIGAVGGA